MTDDRSGTWRGSNGGPVHYMGARSGEGERLRLCARSGFTFPESEMVQQEGRWVHRRFVDEVVPGSGTP